MMDTQVAKPWRTAVAERWRALPEWAERSTAPKRGQAPWRPIVLQATALWLVTRIAYVALTYYAVAFSSGDRVLNGVALPPRAFLHAWQHWDAHWYLRIADLGYFNPQPTAFFPLYPALIHVMSGLVGSSHELAGALLIANIGTLGAFIGVGLLAANEDGRSESAWRSLRVFIAYPLAFFLTAPYTEGLFVAFVAGSLLCARRGSWRWSAAWALLAGLTRPTALALVPALLWEYGRQHGWWRRDAWTAGAWRERLRPKALVEAVMVVGAVPAAIAGFMVFCWERFGDPIMFLRAERIYWYHSKTPPWTALWTGFTNFLSAPMLSDIQARLLVNLAPVLVFLVIAIIGIRRLPLMLTLYTFGILYLSMASPILNNQDVLTSCGRYLIAAIPIFLLLGQWAERRPWLDMLIVSGGFLVQAMLALVYLRNGWVN
ncbi:MAG TPA: mannosyltransferase family protein [Ktedonobacterales bacterium]|nr:mannosyltransferase family protein [Ktedonobacterales bacterium]